MKIFIFSAIAFVIVCFLYAFSLKKCIDKNKKFAKKEDAIYHQCSIRGTRFSRCLKGRASHLSPGEVIYLGNSEWAIIRSYKDDLERYKIQKGIYVDGTFCKTDQNEYYMSVLELQSCERA